MRASQRTGSAARPATGRKLLPTTPVASAMPLLARSCLRCLAHNHRPALDGDAEAVHEMRVALRQLRVLLRAFELTIGARRARAIRAETQWISDELGLVRDLDVFLEALDRENGRARGVGTERRRLARVRRQLHARLVAALRSPRYARLLADTRDAVGGAAVAGAPPAALRSEVGRVDRFAARDLARRWRRFVRAARRVRRLNAEQRHRLRIRGRKLRYAMEFFGDAYPGRKNRNRFRRAVTTLRRLQIALGALNDRLQQRALRDRYAPQDAAAIFRQPAPDTPTTGHRPDRQLRVALRAIVEFERIKPFWA